MQARKSGGNSREISETFLCGTYEMIDQTIR